MRRNLPLILVALAALAWVPAFLVLRDRRAPDVAFITTPPDVVDALLDLATVKSSDVVYDLGCGDGRIVIAAAKRFGARGVGIEIDPELVKTARANVAAAGVAELVRIEQGDIFAADLRPATVVTLYLTPSLNTRLIPQLDALRPGARVVSHQFSMPGARPAKALRVHSPEDGLLHPLYLWVTPLEKEE